MILLCANHLYCCFPLSLVDNIKRLFIFPFDLQGWLWPALQWLIIIFANTTYFISSCNKLLEQQLLYRISCPEYLFRPRKRKLKNSLNLSENVSNNGFTRSQFPWSWGKDLVYTRVHFHRTPGLLTLIRPNPISMQECSRSGGKGFPNFFKSREIQKIAGFWTSVLLAILRLPKNLLWMFKNINLKT